MTVLFYGAAAVAIVATALAITRSHTVHALLYLIVSLLAIAVLFSVLGAPFAAALEVIVYAGAIMVLFLFVVMLLNVGQIGIAEEEHLLRLRVWAGPALLVFLLLSLLVGLIALRLDTAAFQELSPWVSPKDVGMLLYGPYVLGVELISMLLLAGLVAAHHLGRRQWGVQSGDEM